ncbi:MAG: glycosyltransferase family 39 protein [Candidatus Methylomirabilis oxyfera]|nr:glycosyltransferase family 39 protein [Candidatus Methylomirabilis oxyfera]
MESPTLRILFFFLAAFLSVSSGIIASSDGVTIFNVTQAIVERGEISVSGENVAPGVGAKLYSRYGIGLSVVAIPLYLVGKAFSSFIPEQFKLLTLRGSVSLTNAILSALVCLLLVKTGQQLAYSLRTSMHLAMAFAFSTFFVAYATKSFLTQPLETLCLVGTLYWLIAHSQLPRLRNLSWAGFLCGLGVLTKWAFIINLPIFLGYLLAISGAGRRARNLLAFLAPVALGFVLALWYNHARFGSILKTGYWATAAFTTPLFVGLHGLLLSSGKNLFLYAPIAALGVVAMRAFSKSHKREIWLMLGLFTANLLLIAKYRDWGGEGSWGPRYLTLVLPCLVLPIGTLLETGRVALRRTFLALSLAGLLVQFGGVSIYYGTYYRSIGEYPYRVGHGDPRFMYKAHYVPSYSPAWGHLKMAVQNWGRFLAGEKPRLTVTSGRDRIPLPDSDRAQLRDTLDFWFAYAYYAGVPFGLCLLGMTSLMGAAAATGWRLYRSSGERTP